MESSGQIVVFSLGDLKIALPLTSIERVVRAVEITPLPKAPPAILGVINLQGRILPVFDMRRRFRVPARDLELTDHVVIACTRRRTVAFIADSVAGVTTISPDEIVAPDAVAGGVVYVAGIVKRSGGLIFIHDLDAFLSDDEARRMEEALAS